MDHAPAQTLPPPPPEAVRTITHERGLMVRQILSQARAGGQSSLVERLLQAAGPGCVAQFRQTPGFFEWVPSPLALSLHEAWCDFLGLDTMAARGAEAARQMLEGPQGWMLRLASPAFILSSLPKVFPLYYRGGELQVQLREPGHARVHLWARGYPESWFRDALPAWVHTALALAGAREVQARLVEADERSPSPDLHIYDIRWAV